MVSSSWSMYTSCLWYVYLRAFFHQFISSEGNGLQANQVAAHWVPDDKSDTCMHCRASKFSAYNRKHVCEECRIIKLEYSFLALPKLWLYCLWKLLKETFSLAAFGFQTCSSLWCMFYKIKRSQQSKRYRSIRSFHRQTSFFFSRSTSSYTW